MKNCKIKPVIIGLAAAGFYGTLSSIAFAQDTTHGTVLPSGSPAVNVGEVSRGESVVEQTRKKREEKLHSTLHSVHITKKEIENTVPPGGNIVFALKNVPGVQIQGYGGTAGAQRDQIRLNGVTAGWTGTGSNPERNAIQFTFDGVPMNDPYADWEGFETSTIPISAIFSGVKVILGPGNPASRYYDSVGGTIELQTWQPTPKSSAEISVGGGSFNSYNASAILQTGDIDGWRTVISGGYTRSGSFLHSTGQLVNNSQGSALYVKTKRNILNNAGTFSLAGYFSNIEEYRPTSVPVYNTAGDSIYGANIPGPYFSQQSQGFYYMLPNSVRYKNVQGHVYMVWSRLREHLTKRLSVCDLAYYRFGHRIHDRITHYYYDAYAEWYHVDRDEFGDRLSFRYNLPNNLVKFGLSYITMRTKHGQQGYSVDPAYGGPFDPTYIRHLIYNWENFAPYIQDKISLFHHRLTIVPGLMLEHYNYRWINDSAASIPQGDVYLTPTGPSGVIPTSLHLSTNALFSAPNKHVQYNNFEPSIGVNYTFVKHLAGFFTWAEHHTTPQEGAFWGAEPYTVPEAPVTVHSYIGGLRYVNGAMSASLVGFYQHYSNQFLLTETAYEGGLVENISKLSATYNGVDVSLDYQPQYGFSASINATVQHDYYNKYVGSNGIAHYGLPISNVANYTLFGTVGYSWFSNDTSWRVNLTDSYDGAKPLFDENTGLPTDVKWGGHNVLSLFASAKTARFDHDFPGLKYLEGTLSVDNLLGRNYESVVALGSIAPHTPETVFGLAGQPFAVFGSITAKF